MESIDKLRTSLKACTKEAGVVEKFDTYWITADACDHLIDEIEAEIERDYMRLPVDANNEPIHVGDSMAWGSDELEVLAVGNETFCFEYKTERNGESFFEYNVVCSCGYTHFKPRTLEDVLREYSHAYYAHITDNYMNYDGTDKQIIEKYADEIRELLGGDAE